MTSSETSATIATISDADWAAVAGVPQQIIQAWAAQDADAFAAVFTDDGTMILPGVYRKGRDDIREFMTEAFAGPYRGTRVTGAPIDMRALNGSTALVVTQGGVTAPSETEVADGRVVRATWVLLKQEGTWRLAAYQNSPRDAT